MAEIQTNPCLVACCGLYCAACRSYLKGKCPGCKGNIKASWCGVRKCCLAAGRPTCAQCAEFKNPADCRKFNNFISSIFGWLFRSDRAACIAMIRAEGIEKFAGQMAKAGRQTIKRK